MTVSVRSAILAIYVAATLAGCAPRHQFQRLEGPDHVLIATTDYVAGNFGLTRDAVVSVQEKRGLASLVATFGNVDRVEVTWLGPQDLNICQSGRVIGYRRALELNTSTGRRTVHAHYDC